MNQVAKLTYQEAISLRPQPVKDYYKSTPGLYTEEDDILDDTIIIAYLVSHVCEIQDNFGFDTFYTPVLKMSPFRSHFHSLRLFFKVNVQLNVCTLNLYYFDTSLHSDLPVMSTSICDYFLYVN